MIHRDGLESNSVCTFVVTWANGIGMEAEFYDPKATVIGFVFDTVKLRGEKNLVIYMSHLLDVLQR